MVISSQSRLKPISDDFFNSMLPAMQQNLCHTNLAPPKFDTRPPTAYNSGFSKITVHSVHHSFQTTSVFRIPFFSNTTVKNHARFRTTNPTHFQTLEMAEEHGIENANRFRKQDLVFAIVRQMMKQGESFTCSGTLEILPDGFGFYAAQTLPTSQVPTTSTSHPRKSAASTCIRATPSKAACAYPKTTNAISPLSVSTASTAIIPKSANTKSSSKTSPRFSPPSNSNLSATLKPKKTLPAAPLI